jgi:two-component system response regulator VicR
LMSGLKLINYVRNEEKLKIPMIALSSAKQEDIVKQAFEMGANDHVMKPFSPNELLMRLKTQLA